MVTSKEAADLAQYLTFSVAGEEYGISVLTVREILEYDTITRVPRTPAFIRGVINLRGRVVPVVDLASRFGLPPSEVTKRTCVVIVEVELEGERTVMGLIADAVSQVIELGPDDIEPSPSFGTRVDVAYLKGMGRLEKRFVLLLNIDRVLSAGDAEEMAAAVSSEEGAPSQAPAKAGARSSLGAAALAFAACLLGAASVRADDPIQDNSFLIEEAYNQEHGVVQHINTFSRLAGSGDWVYTFTQEWPVHDEKHQLSYTLPIQELHLPAAASTGIGDLALNYRYQALGNGGTAVAFSPRLSVLVPTGRAQESLGAGGVGIQVNLPVSWVMGSRFVTHWNAGATHTVSAKDAAGERADLNAYSLGQSVVWLAKPKVNLLLETSWVRADSVAGPGVTARSDALFVSPGIRWAHDFHSGLQIVPGVAFPIGVGPSRGRHAVFVYLSLEHPFEATRH
jgi:chemotaxis signal transduction protein